jgi:DNA helicase II / ATP-dependent DNA helicase PcrA
MPTVSNLDLNHPLFAELKRLNPEQYQAVTTTKGFVLVLAGAGSGKTRVLTLRIAYLILTQGVSPEAIVAMTFTNKAAGEMKERLIKLIGHKLASKVFIGTFHSFCLKLLRNYIHHLGYTENFTLYSESDVKRIFKQLAATYLDENGELPPLDNSFSAILMAKTLGEIPKDQKNSWHDEFLKSTYESLKISMRAFNAVDFDGLLDLTCALFEHHPHLVEDLLCKTEYVLIDEYQDSNPMQFKIAQGLSSHHKNLFVVGDDDQSIYGWRGARIENILNFPADTKIKLEQNYRSSPTILHAANAVIGNNKTRHQKTLKSNARHDDKISIFHAPTDTEEAQAVVLRLLKIKEEQNLKFSDFAILYRSNSLSRPFELALNNMVYKTNDGFKRGIPHIVVGGLEFFERAEVKDVTAFLRLCVNPCDQEALLRVINVPRRGLSDKILDTITSYQRKEKSSLYDHFLALSEPFSTHPLAQELSSKTLGSISAFISAIEEAKKGFKSDIPYHITLKKLLDDICYQDAIKEDVKSDKMRQFKQESVDLFLENLKSFEKSQESASLYDFLATINLDENFMLDKSHDKDAVTLMTLHSSKGLEFEICFIVGLEDHILPHEKSLKTSSLEEERRLFYVGITRGKAKVILSMAQSRSRNGKLETSHPSRFLFEIPEELLEISSYKQF